MTLFERLTRVVNLLGWGPYDASLIAFCREGRGWRVGEGVMVTPWHKEPWVSDAHVPTNPRQALLDIELYLYTNGELEVTELELLGYLSDTPKERSDDVDTRSR